MTPRPSIPMRDKELISTTDVFEQASSLLKLAGFELRNVSMRTEACYFALPCRTELLRVALHKRKRPFPGLTSVVAKLTLTGRGCEPAGFIWMRQDKIETLVANAIGRYMLRCGVLAQKASAE